MAARNFGTLTVDVVAKVGGFEEGMDKAERATQKFNKSVQSQQQDLDRLIGKIDPVVGRLSEIDRMEEKLRQHRKNGLLPADDFDEYLTKLNGMRNALGSSAADFTKAGKSAGEMNAALRTLPAQFTDIFTSLQAGQDPMTVFLQQGGQIKDQFGGIGPAARAAGSYILGLINPFTVAAAAAGTLFVAYEKGAQEQRGFQNTLTLTGNTAGTTADALSDMSAEMDDFAGTQRKAAAALNEVVSSGKFTADQLEMVTKTAVLMQEATGKAVSETIDDFASLADDPVKAVKELNDQYNFLTADIYRQVVALQESGDTIDAQRLVMESYADTMRDRASQVSENIGWIETAWKGVVGAAADVWDAMLDVGRADTVSQKIANIREQLADSAPVSNSGVLGGVNFNYGERNKALQAQLAILEGIQFANEQVAKSEGEQQQQQNALIANLDARNKLEQEYQSRQDQLLAKQKEINKVYDEAVKNADSQAEINKLEAERDGILAQLEERYKSIGESRSKAYRDDAATRELQKLQQQAAAYQAQLQSSTKLSNAESELVKFNQQIADLKSKDQLTADQKSLLASEDRIRAQLEVNAALAGEIKARKDIAQLENLQQAQAEALDARRNQAQLNVLGVSTGDQELQRLKELNQVERDYAKQRAELERQRADASVGMTDEMYRARLEIIQNGQQAEIDAVNESYQAMADAQADWENGAQRAWANFETDAANTASSMESLFSGALDSTSDAIADFVTTGKLSFSDLANSIIKDLARIGVQKAIVGMAGSLFGGSSEGESGGSVEGLFASGGYVSGPGTGTSDSIPARLSNGEFVINAQATAKNRPILEAINSGRGFADGGYVSADSGGSNSYTITSGNSPSSSPIIQQTITVQGDASESTVARLQEAARQGAEQGYRLVLQDFRRNGQALQLARKGIK